MKKIAMLSLLTLLACSCDDKPSATRQYPRTPATRRTALRNALKVDPKDIEHPSKFAMEVCAGAFRDRQGEISRQEYLELEAKFVRTKETGGLEMAQELANRLCEETCKNRAVFGRTWCEDNGCVACTSAMIASAYQD